MNIELKKNDKVKTSLGSGVFLGWECYKIIGTNTVNKKEVYSIQEELTDEYFTTKRKAVKMSTGEYKDSILYFYPSDKITKDS